MDRKEWLLLLVAVLLAGNLVGRFLPFPASAAKAVQYKLFDIYGTYNSERDLEKSLNDQAKEGWKVTVAADRFLILKK